MQTERTWAIEQFPQVLHEIAYEQHRNDEEQILSESEWQQLAAWNATGQDYARERCVPQLVAVQAAATPDAVALVDGNVSLSYHELNERANQLAHHLRSLGVKPNMLVGICVTRSFDLVIGLLGILKAGGAYLPLDPTYPAERLTFMLEDAKTSILVTQQRFVERLAISDTRLVLLDADAAELARQSSAEPPASATIADLVYVIYTSGSTGRPKGVQITHDSLLNLVYWHQRAFEVTPGDRATQLTSPAFDATGWELWPYLTAGASVYLMDEDARVVPELCRDWLLAHEITITFLPTTLAESVMALKWPSSTSLRLLLTGADTLHVYPAPELPFALINNYGPTEATVVATFGRVAPTLHAETPPSIGRPIANTRIYILDDQLRQVPIGVAGELYIGGAGLAKGYLNRPELTAERFISNPFSDQRDERLYRTGDMARYLPDGQIAFMGRADSQVKIRGYRIEPGEIVSLLNEHATVQASMVVAREDTPGDKRLIAYIVPVSGVEVTASALRETLMSRLPDYMIPAAFVLLDAFPLTPNGKVDRAALPAPDAFNMARDEVIAAPQTLVEKRLAGVITSLLGLEQIGIDDNFFLLGGNSLMGTQIIMQVMESFKVELPLRTLFEAPTVRLLAEEIERLVVAKLETMSDDEVLRQLLSGA